MEDHVKKAVSLVALLVAFATPAAAQQGTVFGAKVGINFANLNFDPDEGVDTSNKTGVAAGVFMGIPVNSRFSFQPEVLFSMQGAELKDEEFGEEATIKLDYINVPLLANINLATGPNSFSFLVGPQIGFRTSAKIKGGGEEEDLKDDTESTDFGVVFGVAATMRNFVIDARYTHGLRNINSADEADDVQDVKNRVFTISIGLLFR
jgi:hypothetical protein